MQRDDDRDETPIEWELPSPLFYGELCNSISGKVTEADGQSGLKAADP